MRARHHRHAGIGEAREPMATSPGREASQPLELGDRRGSVGVGEETIATGRGQHAPPHRRALAELARSSAPARRDARGDGRDASLVPSVLRRRRPGFVRLVTVLEVRHHFVQ